MITTTSATKNWQRLPADAQEAAELLLRRREAAQNLIPFAEYTKRDYQAGRHHELVAAKLEAVERGEITRLMVLMPPRHGKSELVSIRFPAWYLGRNPDRQIIQASYNSDFAAQFGRQVRNTIAGKSFAHIFPNVMLSADSKAADLWHTNQGGVYLSTGIGGASTGFGAHLLNIDDPIKSREEADSETYRERTWEWYSAVARTRLMPNGAIVLTYTPWHEDDVGMRLLERMESGGERWEVLRLPAIADGNGDAMGRKKGEALWPEWYDNDALAEIKQAVIPRDWSALYQCQPTPDAGDYFRREWFGYYDELPRGIRFYLCSDFAVSEDAQADWTVHIVFGVSDKLDLYVVDLWRDKREADEGVDQALDLIAEYKPMAWINEKGPIVKSLGPFIHRRQLERRIVCHRIEYPRAVDKIAATRSFQARMSQGAVKLPRVATWLADFERELLSFPAGRHDDQVDACALIGMHMDKIAKPLLREGQRRQTPRLELRVDPLRG